MPKLDFSLLPKSMWIQDVNEPICVASGPTWKMIELGLLKKKGLLET